MRFGIAGLGRALVGVASAARGVARLLRIGVFGLVQGAAVQIMVFAPTGLLGHAVPGGTPRPGSTAITDRRAASSSPTTSRAT